MSALRFGANHAFTLIELLVVILIVALLIAVALPAFLGQTNKAYDSSVEQQLSAARTEAKAIWTSAGQGGYPTLGPQSAPGTLLAQLHASEPQMSFADGSAGTGAAVGTVDVWTPDANTVGMCELSKSGTYFCVEANEATGELTAPVSDQPAGAFAADSAQAASLSTSVYASGSTEAAARCPLDEALPSADTPYYSASCTTYAGQYSASTTSWPVPIPGSSGSAGAGAGIPPTNTVLPSITGSAAIGQTLTASPGTWTQNPAAYSYQWQDCGASSCSNINGATAATYTVASSDAGSTIGVLVTAAGTTGAAASAQTQVVQAAGAPVADATGYNGLSAAVDANGIVHLSGVVKTTTSEGTGSVIATLPASMDPKYMVQATVWAHDATNGNMILRVAVTTSGQIEPEEPSAFGTWTGSAGSYVSLSNFTYPTAATEPNWTALPIASGWTNWNASTNSPAAYYKDSDGIVHLQGMLTSPSGGVTISGTNATIATLPAGYRPAQALFAHVIDNDGRYDLVTIFPNGNVTITNDSAAQYTMSQAVYYLDNVSFAAAGSGLTWTTPALASGFAEGSIPFAYAVAPDGIVYTRGEIDATASYAANTPVAVATVPATVAPTGNEFSDFGGGTTTSLWNMGFRVEARSNGTIYLNGQTNTTGASTDWVQTESDSWVSAGTTLDFQPVTPAAGWLNY